MKNKKFLVFSIAIGLVLVLGIGSYYWKLSSNSDQINSLAKKVNHLYTDGNKNFLAANVSQSQIDVLLQKTEKIKINSLSNKAKSKLNEITKDLKNAQNMLSLQSKSGSLLDSKGAIAENIDITDIEKQSNSLNKIKPKFVAKIVIPILEEVKSQQKNLATAKDLVNALFQDSNTVKSNVTQESFNGAKSAVEKVKNEVVKANLTMQLDKVNKAISDRNVASALNTQNNIPSNSTTSSSSTTKAKTTSSTGTTSGGGVTIGDGGPTPGYTVNGRLYSDPNAYNVMRQKELAGCPYCGKNDCHSFYGTNQWGYTVYNQKLCPNYDASKDPAVIDMVTGLPWWSPTEPHGVRVWLKDTVCPTCNRLIPAGEHHYD